MLWNSGVQHMNFIHRGDTVGSAAGDIFHTFTFFLHSDSIDKIIRYKFLKNINFLLGFPIESINQKYLMK